MVYTENLVDPESDFAEASIHLNVHGARKVTDYLAKFLKDQFDLPDHRQDPAYIQWNDYDTLYRQRANQKIVDAEGIAECLNDMCGSTNVARLQIKSGTFVHTSLLHLIKAMQDQVEVTYVDSLPDGAKPEDAYYIEVSDVASGEMFASHFFVNPE